MIVNLKAEAMPTAVKFKVQSADAKELERFFCSYESEVGFRSSFGSMLNALNGLSTHDVVDQDLNAIARIGQGGMRQVWRALNLLDKRGDRRTILVLHRMHGPFVLEEEDIEKRATGPNVIPLSYRKAFGDDAAPIVVMTPAAMDLRDDLAYHRSSIRVDAVNANIEAIPERAGTEFWRYAKHCEQLMKVLGSMKAPYSTAQKDDRKQLRIELQSVRREMLRVMTPTVPECPLNAVISAIGAADKETSVNEAIRHILGRGKEKDSFVKLAKAQALTIRDAARSAYLAAKRELKYL